MALQAPSTMVSTSPQCTAAAYSDGSARTCARLAGQLKQPVACGLTAAGSTPRAMLATARLSTTRAQSARRIRATGQVSAAEPARNGTSWPPASAAVNSRGDPASGAGSCVRRMAGPVKTSSTPHAVARRFRTRASPAAVAQAAAPT
jgi:hypothetical protein